MLNKLGIGVLLGASLFVVSNDALAQVSGFPQLGRIGPSGAQVAGAAIGAAAVIGVVVYFAIPKQTTIEGCVESGEGGLRLTNDKTTNSYLLVPGEVRLQTGERVAVKGKKGKEISGLRVFEVKKLVKNEGPCG